MGVKVTRCATIANRILIGRIFPICKVFGTTQSIVQDNLWVFSKHKIFYCKYLLFNVSILLYFELLIVNGKFNW